MSIALTVLVLLHTLALFNRAQRIDSSFNVIDSSIVDLIWCNKNEDKVIIALSENGYAYRSDDKGKIWEKINSYFHKSAQDVTNQQEDIKEEHQILELISNPYDKNVIIFVGKKHINWITFDCALSLRAMNHGRQVNEFQFHPIEKKWLLASAWTRCDDFVKSSCRKYKELFISKDLGMSWQSIATYIYQFAWGKINDHIHIPKERIIVAYDPKGFGNQTKVRWKDSIRISYSDDFFETTQPLVIHGNRFLLTEKYFFVARALNDDTGELLVSLMPNLRHKELNFSVIHIPDIKDLDHHSYTVLDSSGHQIFLHINHYGPQSRYGSIFISDQQGSKFSLSLSNHIRISDGQTDFEKLQGIEGIIIANVYDDTAIRQYERDQEQNINYEKHSSNSKQHTIQQPTDLENNKKTLISFDNGAIWQPIQAPLYHANGSKIFCSIQNNCSLHLNSQSNGHQFGPVYSTKNSIGLIIGTGNIGQHLSTKSDRINTYISNDAGRTWREIQKGSHIYDVGDHGGIIVIASDQQATDTIYYSLDEGITWEPFKFSNELIEVTNIIIEPSNTGTDFLIIGKNKKSIMSQGIISSIDFSKIYSTECKGAEEAGQPLSDFEQWSPKQGSDDSYCLLGRRVIYIKKKRDRKCFNGEQFERRFIIQNCHCTESDWECDYGFVRTSSGPCIRQDGQDIRFDPPSQCLGYYHVSIGYRKVAGDTCILGVQHEPIRLQCPGINPQYVVLSLIALILFLLLLLLNKNNMARLKIQFRSVCFYCFHQPSSSTNELNNSSKKNNNQANGFSQIFSRGNDYENKGYFQLDQEPESLLEEDQTFNMENLKKRFDNYEY